MLNQILTTILTVLLGKTPGLVIIVLLWTLTLGAQPLNEVTYLEFKDKSLGITSAIASDHDGFVWLSTRYGLLRYDGTSYINLSDLVTDIPPLTERVQHLFVDSHNQLWYYKSSLGLYRIDLNSFNWQYYPSFNLDRSTNFYYSFYEHPEHDLFIPHKNGLAHYRRDQDTFDFLQVAEDDDFKYVCGIENGELLVSSNRQIFKFDYRTGKSRSISPFANAHEGIVADIAIDNHNNLWISNWYSDQNGLICYDLNADTVKTVFGSHESGRRYISNTDIWQILPDDKGVYFATNAGGVWYYVYDTDNMQQIKRRTGAQKNSTDQVRSIHKDKFGRLWLGSSVDVYVEVLHSKPISQIQSPGEASSMPSNNVFTVAAISSGEVAIGSDQGLTIYDLQTDKFKYRLFSNYNSNRYNNQLNHLFEYEGDLWVGTWSSLIRLDVKTLQTLEYYITFSNAGTEHDPKLIKFEIGAAFQSTIDAEGNLWILNDQKYLVRISGTANQRLIEKYHLINNEIEAPSLGLVFHPSHGVLAASSRDIWSYDKVKTQFNPIPVLGDTLTDHENTQLCQALDQRWYILNGDAIFEAIFTSRGMELSTLGVARGYHDLDNLIIDNNKIFWITEREGIIRWDLNNGHLQHLDAELLLFSSSINTMININKAALDRQGHLFYATNNGVIQINTNEFTINRDAPYIVLTSLEADGKKVTNLPVHNLKNITLKHSQNNLQISYSLLNDSEPDNRSFAYRMQDSDSWIQVGSQSSVYLSGLAPKAYTFQVKATNSDGIEAKMPYSLIMIIKPPWHKSKLAVALYVLFGVSFIFMLYRIRLNTTLAEREALRTKELDQFKNRFFTNITHEFRTPLTVISGIAEKIEDAPEKWSKRGASLIKRNSKTLLHLINQILDLSKLEQGMIKRNLVQDDIVRYIRFLTQSFRSHAAGANQTLIFTSEPDHLIMDFDENHIQTIVSNLLSNAIKYADEPGEIYLEISTYLDSKQPMVEVKIKDQGVGISQQHLPHIFDRYYRVDDEITGHEVGSGIGLALTKEVVEKSGGSIKVQSELGRGSTFTVRLPIEQKSSSQRSERKAITEADVQPAAKDAIHETSILIIEDNDDVAEYIRLCLSSQYNCQRARNGMEGLAQAITLMPDLIITDVMMPLMSGTEMVKTLRKDRRIDHIPVIMLTAKIDVADRIEGIVHGADIYIGKPFAEQELRAHITQLISQRRVLKEKFQGQQDLPENLDYVARRNHDYLAELKRIVNDHLDDTTFGVEELAREVHLSSRQLSRKLEAISDLTVNQLIRSERIEQAKILLVSTIMTITEVSYAVGFSSAQYFATVFKKEVGLTPGEFIESKQKG